VLYSALLIFATLAHKHLWLATGALATATIYAGTAAVHVILLAMVSVHGIYDLDLAAAGVVVITAACAYRPVVELSTTMVLSPYRLIFVVWATLLGISSVFLVAGLVLVFKMPTKPRYIGSGGALLVSPFQLSDPVFDCTYLCFRTRQLFRIPSESVVSSQDAATGVRFLSCLIVSICELLFK
jgi:hypothetical protein